ncbi:MAG: polymerase, sigma-24 subunit, subfamily [Frankiales bacterium]|jgi:RNA polymerase sigma-70 factor (sigma-E family)|nr:polymerase, sigma-24 subunit, subfamily [Frankiales bacterium]
MGMDTAFEEYVVARSGALLRTAYLLTGNRADAEDLLQTTLAKTYLAWDRIREREAVDGYVRRTMVNTQSSFWRRKKPESLYDQPPEHPGRDIPADRDLHDALWTALARLGTKQRAIVVLRYYEDLTEADTAALLGISVGTVKSTTSRALAALRRDASLRDDPRAALPLGAQP